MEYLFPFTGIFFLCESQIDTCLPTNWVGVCTLVCLIPPVSYTTNSEIIPVPVVNFMRTERDVSLTPLAVGMGSARLGVSGSQFQRLSEALKESLGDTALQISAIQDQKDSLAAAVLQNERTRSHS
jgi:hypothetical protein